LVTHVRGWLSGLFVALSVAVCAVAASYILLNHFYGTPKTEIIWRDVVPIAWENAEQLEPAVLTWENMEQVQQVYDVENIEWFACIGLSSWGNAEAHALAVVTYDENTKSISALNWENAENSKPYVLASTVAGIGAGFLPEADRAGAGAPSEGAIASTPFIVSETKSISVFPISASIGIAMGFMVLAVWIGYRRMWGDAATTLLEQGLHDMTVRDVEIVGQIMDLKEFTIPELVRRTHVSKITVWRTVQKLIKQELVKPIEQTKPAANGLGGRGKPSRVYKYIGARASEKSSE